MTGQRAEGIKASFMQQYNGCKVASCQWTYGQQRIVLPREQLLDGQLKTELVPSDLKQLETGAGQQVSRTNSKNEK